MQANLQSIGVLTPLMLIRLDNARTLQIHLLPDDEVGELVCDMVNPKSDTLGNVQRLCRHIYCMSEQNKKIFLRKIEAGGIGTITQGINIAETIREKNRDGADR